MNTHDDTPELRSWLIGLLKDDNVKNVRVAFTKKDGTERVLAGTLIESRIPSEHHPKSETPSSSTDSALRVFDTEAQGWRSFRWDSIKTISFDMS